MAAGVQEQGSAIHGGMMAIHGGMMGGTGRGVAVATATCAVRVPAAPTVPRIVLRGTVLRGPRNGSQNGRRPPERAGFRTGRGTVPPPPLLVTKVMLRGNGVPLLLPSTAQGATTVRRLTTAITGTPTAPHPQRTKGQGLRAAIADGLRTDTLLWPLGAPGMKHRSLSPSWSAAGAGMVVMVREVGEES